MSRRTPSLSETEGDIVCRPLPQFLRWALVYRTAALPSETCGHPEMVSNTNAFKDEAFSVGQRLRYKCQTGYKRKAGTSSLIICQKNGTSGEIYWTMPNITCIRDTSLASPTTVTSAEGMSSTKPTSLTTAKTFPPSATAVSTPPGTSSASQPSTAHSAQAKTISVSALPREATPLFTTANATSWPLPDPSSPPTEQSTPWPFTDDSSSSSETKFSSSALQGGLSALIVVPIVLLGVFIISWKRSRRDDVVQPERPMNHNRSEEPEVTSPLAVGFLSPNVPIQNITEEETVL
uniref:Interleukin-15 receptor subunit alpha isoform X2 n=1 Tax=Geotrypetes seraphini TaxID=260995 RepID=A0A6P8SK35_GEOSA|nr:interleukin-15 receptor subunit alpha isoform X2 [Geotrypetes seraphini]XP_033815621.1 interleukin-15 receptor subunit alpha isoform X2 [Geotrypetes seraphini]